MQIKKVLAVVMSLCMAAGVVSYGAPVITHSITAQAAEVETDCYSFDEATGVLTLRGEVNNNVLTTFNYKYSDKIKSVITQYGTILPSNSRGLFAGLKNCTSIDLSKADSTCVSDMSSMFSRCSSLTNLNLNGFDTSGATNMYQMFNGCSKITTLDLSGFDTRKVTNMAGMFCSCSNLVNLDFRGYVQPDNSNLTGNLSLNNSDCGLFNTSNVRDMNNMFSYCSSLTSIDLSGFDTRNVTNMSYMFLDCKSLTSLDVSGFDVSKVTYINGLFHTCSGLTSLDVSGFNTSAANTISYMFCGCSGLTELDVSGFDTSNVEAMYNVFQGCSNLIELDLSGFDTSNVKYMDKMFGDCGKLKTLKINKNFKNITKEATLPNGEGWVNVKDPKTVVSGSGDFAIIENNGKNTYKRLPIEEETKPTYPTNIKVEYSEKYHQVRFTWDKVDGADRYGIAVYLAGKWRVQAQNITETVYTSPKNLTPGKTYKVAIAARVNGTWDTTNAIKNAVDVTIK
ncbi:BspA family leucine-rich repeat surface protein [Ruminococcus albus]|uniref:Surface protein n=1 Tax=Ruminococcus albus TaxID=1264 RepID=A0A1I1GKN4_RUMAL|nr:BspA family leucine-rich repeat surface protein [Ruminococcus albus]SFC12016.1 surface protein [Ruminococcus albus]